MQPPEPEEADEGHDDSANHDPHFEPIIPLPELVEVKTGEEDEEIKFVHRSKVMISSNSRLFFSIICIFIIRHCHYLSKNT